jgi:hypothetical protein
MSAVYLTVGLELSICIQKAFTVGQLRGNTIGRTGHNEDGAVETECDWLDWADCLKGSFLSMDSYRNFNLLIDRIRPWVRKSKLLIKIIRILIKFVRWQMYTVLSAFETFKKATVNFVTSVLSGWNNSAPTMDGFSWNFILQYFSKNLLRKFKFNYNRTRITGNLPEAQSTFNPLTPNDL